MFFKQTALSTTGNNDFDKYGTANAFCCCNYDVIITCLLLNSTMSRQINVMYGLDRIINFQSVAFEAVS